MFEKLWDDVLCHIAFGNFYFTQIGDLIGEEKVDAVLEEMQKDGLIYFAEVRVHITDKGLQRIQGKLSAMVK